MSRDGRLLQRIHPLSVDDNRARRREGDLHVAGEKPAHVLPAAHDVTDLNELTRKIGGHTTQLDP
jgi:hypothetical protein